MTDIELGIALLSDEGREILKAYLLYVQQKYNSKDDNGTRQGHDDTRGIESLN